MTEFTDRAGSLGAEMQQSIKDFEAGQLSLDRLMWELKSRIAALREVADTEWVDDLKAIWNQLEVINAFFIESGRNALNPQERQDVEDVLSELRTSLVRY